MSEIVDDATPATVDLSLDPRRPTFVSFFGRKGSGKSVLAAHCYQGWAGDKLCIDPTGDADVGDDARELTAPLPSSWPWSHDDKPQNLRFVPDFKAETYLDDMDRAVEIAWSHRKDVPVLLWGDEAGNLTNASRTPPAMRAVLHQGRHRRISALWCQPRPVDINPLVISQSDYVAVFQMPHPLDKERVASNVGVPLKARGDDPGFEDLVNELEEFHFLWIDVRNHAIFKCPPIPLRSKR